MKFIIGMMLFMLQYETGIAQHKSVMAVTDFEKVIQSGAVQLIDVRTPAEYKEGYIKGAVNADWQNEQQFIARVKELDKTKPVYVYCLSGVRSGKAADWFAANGFTQIINLAGGIKAWKDADKPVVK